MMDRFLSLMIAAVVLAIAGIFAYFWWQQRQAVPVAATVLQPETEAPASPASTPAIVNEPAVIQYPIEAAGPVAPGAPPALKDSDKYFAEKLAGLVPPKELAAFFQLDGFARRAVATVDNLARPHAAPLLWPVNPTAGRFTTAEAGATSTSISPENSKRYTPLVRLIESVDAAKAVTLYAGAYPVFQQAYVELGYPRGYFNDRLVKVIDHLLATPTAPEAPPVVLTEVKGSVSADRPWVRYEFEDPTLESLSSGQKMLLRIGPDHQARLKIKLTEFRRQIVGTNVTQSMTQPASAPRP